jgi:hypothetical protein
MTLEERELRLHISGHKEAIARLESDVNMTEQQASVCCTQFTCFAGTRVQILTQVSLSAD